jgi:hypothetical protein
MRGHRETGSGVTAPRVPALGAAPMPAPERLTGLHVAPS